MQKIKQYWIIILIFFIAVIGWFYWFELRPVNIIKKCQKKAMDSEKMNDREDYEYFYKKCQRENGLDLPYKADWKL